MGRMTLSNRVSVLLYSVKNSVKGRVQSSAKLWGGYLRLKGVVVRVWVMWYFAYDIRNTFKAMSWPPAGRDRMRLSAELYFQYHKLEKGLVMPGPRRMFGNDPAVATIRLAQRWVECGLDRRDPVFLGAVETLVAYAHHVEEHRLDPTGLVTMRVRSFLERVSERDPTLVTPQPLSGLGGTVPEVVETFRRLVLARRSVREFQSTRVSEGILRDAISMAQQAPSACNRQPWNVYLVSDDAKKKELLHYQNGNRGFGHLVPHVALITADERCFFDASERHEPYIDGGLFAMAFILALRAHGVGTCCLNWCVAPNSDQAVHRVLEIPAERRIVMLLAIGYPVVECMVPRSPRRSIDDVFIRVA